MGQRHIEHAEFAELAQHRQAAAELVPALDPHQRRDLALRSRRADFGGGLGEHEGVGVRAHHALDDVDLVERGLNRLRAGLAGGDVERPELPADLALAQTRDVGLQRLGELAGVARQIDRLDRAVIGGAQFPGEVVMPVDHRGLRQHPLHPRAGCGIGFGRCRLGGGEEQRGEGECDHRPSLVP